VPPPLVRVQLCCSSPSQLHSPLCSLQGRDVSLESLSPSRLPRLEIVCICRHDQRVTERIALELFFHDSKFNWYESHWEDEISQWAKENNEAFKSARQGRPGLYVGQCYAETVLGWQDVLGLVSIRVQRSIFIS
jgi:hypothetical protein